MDDKMWINLFMGQNLTLSLSRWSNVSHCTYVFFINYVSSSL